MIPAGVLVIVVAVGNVMSNPVMPQPAVRSDLARLYSLEPAAVCATEIEPARYAEAFHRLGLEHGYRTRRLATPNPIAVRQRSPWRIMAARARLLSLGIEGLTPDRWALVLGLENRRGLRVVLVCTHLVSRAWTHVEPSTELRRALWRQAAHRIRRIVAFWTGRGVPVIVLGDLNHPGPVRWARHQRVLANRGLLQIAVIAPARMRVRAGAERVIPAGRLHTDHPMIRRRIRLEPRPGRGRHPGQEGQPLSARDVASCEE